jgi:hypothetical protein
VRILSALFLAMTISLGCSASAPAPQISGENAPVYLGFVFPESVAGFSLSKFQIYDDKAAGAGVTYRTPSDSTLLISVFAFPAPKNELGEVLAIADHFAGARAGVLQHSAGSRSIPWPNEYVGYNKGGVVAHHEAFELVGNWDQPTISLLQIYDYGEKRLKFRISYGASDEIAPPLIEDFHEAFPFPRHDEISTPYNKPLQTDKSG